MKTSSLVLILIMMLMSACSKDKPTRAQIKSRIIGLWELELLACGECMVSSTTFPPGTGNTLEFTKGDQFTMKSKDSVLTSGRYEIIVDEECNKRGNIALTMKSGAATDKRSITFDNDKLQLSTPICYTDGATSIYHRRR